MQPYFKILRRLLTTQDINNMILKNKCRFDGNLRRACITAICDGRCTADMEICTEHTDVQKNIHVGMISTLIDSFTTFGLLSHKNSEMVDSVSVDICITFLQFPCMGKLLCIQADSLKVGKKLGFTSCLISNKCSGELIAIGAHTKYLSRK